MRWLISKFAAAILLAGCTLPEPRMLQTETHQFDFLLGEWDVQATRRNPDGTSASYRATWTARSIDEGRVVMDEFRARHADGSWLSTYVTLRTYAPATKRWEITGLAALQPAAPMRWSGEWVAGEMRMLAEGADTQGRPVKTRIRFHDIEADRFSWESEISLDGGAHWLQAASLKASRTAH